MSKYASVALEDPRNGEDTAKKLIFSTISILAIGISIYDDRAVEVMLPRVQEYFGVRDSEVASIQTMGLLSATLSLVLMWWIGDRFHRGKLLRLALVLELAFKIIALLAGPANFMMFIASRSVSAFTTSIVVVLMPVILAEFYEGASLNTASVLSDFAIKMMTLLCTSVSSILVSSNLSWKVGLFPAPLLLAIAVLVGLCTQPRLKASGSYQATVGLCSSFTLLLIPSFSFALAAIALSSFLMASDTFWQPKILLIALNTAPAAYLGLSYPVVMTLNSAGSLAGTLLGVPAWLALSRSWQRGTHCFGCGGSGARAVLFVLIIEFSLSILAQLAQIYLLNVNYAGLLATFFLRHFSEACFAGLLQFVVLTVTPQTSRAGAVALMNLSSYVAMIPAAQVFGSIADWLKGDSALPVDQLVAYQQTLLMSVLAPAAAALCLIAAAFYANRDELRERSSIDANEDNETDLLIGEKRKETYLEAALRSRTTTMNSYRY